MPAHYAVAAKIVVVLLLVATGWLLRRRNIIEGSAIKTLSRVVIDVALPALVITELVRTVDRTTLSSEIAAPILGALILIVGHPVGWVLSRAFVSGRGRSTFSFLVGTPNWIFLPLLIAEPLGGANGIRVVLLFNVGAQLALWTVGVGTLQGKRPSLRVLASLASNPGLIATVIGLICAVMMPEFRTLVSGSVHTPLGTGLSTVWSGIALLGSMAIPLSVITTGAQLGEVPIKQLLPTKDILGVTLGRLLLVPMAMLAIAWLLSTADLGIPNQVIVIAILISSMPVAISTAPFAKRFDGDHTMAARAVFFTTVLSLVTAPATMLVWSHFMT